MYFFRASKSLNDVYYFVSLVSGPSLTVWSLDEVFYLDLWIPSNLKFLDDVTDSDYSLSPHS